MLVLLLLLMLLLALLATAAATAVATDAVKVGWAPLATAAATAAAATVAKFVGCCWGLWDACVDGDVVGRVETAFYKKMKRRREKKHQ